MLIYALHDDKTKHYGTIPCESREKALELNSKGYGIFWTLNDFNGSRLKTNLVNINYWHIDIDGGNKDEQIVKLLNSPIEPTMIIETKNGHHAYWKALDATVENWYSIVADRLIPYFDADVRAKDYTRLLRVPNFLHQKDINDKFMIKVVAKDKEGLYYSESDMMSAFKDMRVIKEHKEPSLDDLTGVTSFWGKAMSLDVEEGLKTLSGTKYVNYEDYTFYDNHDGSRQIICNGEKTSCWITTDGRIGSYTGCFNIPTWLYYFSNDWYKVAVALKDVFKLEGDNIDEKDTINIIS